MKKRKLMVFLLCAAFMILAGCNSNTEEKEEAAKSQITSEREISQTVSEEESSETEQSQRAESSAEERGEAEPAELSGSSSEESEEGMTSEELEMMRETETYIQDFVNSKKYQKASLDERRKMTVDFLGTLAEKGLILKESIYESNDMVSFSYSSGALGGVQIREWDPMMNGTEEPVDQARAAFSSELITVPASDAQKLGQKTYDTFLGSIKTDTKSTNRFHHLMTQTLKQEGIRYELLALSGERKKTGVSGVLYQVQQSGNQHYHAVKTVSDGKITGTGEVYLMNGEQKYYLDEDKKMCVVCNQEENELPDMGANFENLAEYVGSLIRSGTTMLDGKEMNFELFSDGSVQTVAYFDGDTFVKAEVYQPSDYLQTDYSNVSEGVLRLSGCLYLGYTDELQKELFEIPQNYQTVTYEEYSAAQNNVFN